MVLKSLPTDGRWTNLTKLNRIEKKKFLHAIVLKILSMIFTFRFKHLLNVISHFSSTNVRNMDFKSERQSEREIKVRTRLWAFAESYLTIANDLKTWFE